MLLFHKSQPARKQSVHGCSVRAAAAQCPRQPAAVRWSAWRGITIKNSYLSSNQVDNISDEAEQKKDCDATPDNPERSLAPSSSVWRTGEQSDDRQNVCDDEGWHTEQKGKQENVWLV